MELRRQHGQAPVEVNMTPLIDVTFLLLIFFMIVSVFNQMERTAKLELPEAYQAIIERDVAKERTVVNVESDGTVVMYGRRYDLEAFRGQLRALSGTLRKLGARTGEAPIVLRGDKDTPYRHIRQVISAIYEADIRRVMFAAYRKREEEREEW
jgi:biopolymer transport protein ExbD